LAGLEADLGVGEGWIEWLATPLWRSKKIKNSEKYCGYDRKRKADTLKRYLIIHCNFYFVALLVFLV